MTDYADLSKAHVKPDMTYVLQDTYNNQIGLAVKAFDTDAKVVYVGFDTVCNHGPFVASSLDRLQHDMTAANNYCDPNYTPKDDD